jgi:hypothetical protein
MSSNPKIEALLQACDALSQDLDPLLAELVKDQDQRRIDALISLFDAASTLDPDLFGDRIDRIGEAKVSCDSAYHDVCDELDALASVALTPAQDQLLSDLFDIEEMAEELRDADQHDQALEVSMPLWTNRAEPPAIYLELEQLGMVELEDDGDEDESWWNVALTAAGHWRVTKAKQLEHAMSSLADGSEPIAKRRPN